MMAPTSNRVNSMGIYCHIPFCIQKCAYCDFYSFPCPDRQTIADYFKALHREIKNFAAGFLSHDNAQMLPIVDSVYFGGGTPSSVKAEYIETTLALLYQVFPISEDAEITIEVNPGTLNPDKVKRYRSAGFNRVSVGLQAWQDHLLKTLGRIHSQSDFIAAMALLKAGGFNNISVDVMYGLPGQKLADLMETLKALMAFSPTHLSCYSLILEEGTAMTKWVEAGQLDLPDEDLEREMHWEIDRFLKAQGYDHYEISSYCKPKYQSRHNLKYWELAPYLGFGLGAGGFFNGVRYGNTNDLKDYGRLIEAGKAPGENEPAMKKEDRMSEWMFLGLRKLKGIDDHDFKLKFNQSFFTVYKEEINMLVKNGLLVQEGLILRLTPKGQDFGNQVFMAFV